MTFVQCNAYNNDWMWLQAEEQRVNREKELEQEERKAKEQARIDHEKQKDEKMRRLIIENRYKPFIMIFYVFMCNLDL